MKCHKDPAGKIRPADEGEYSFAKYNKKVLEGFLLPATLAMAYAGQQRLFPNGNLLLHCQMIRTDVG